MFLTNTGKWFYILPTHSSEAALFWKCYADMMNSFESQIGPQETGLLNLRSVLNGAIWKVIYLTP